MLYEIFKFELKYRSTRPATYIYFAIIFLMCFGAVTTDIIRIGGGAGQIKENAPFVISNMTLIMSFALSVIISAVMGVAILRDFEHNTEALMFSTPMKKIDYLMGRFLGSFVVLLFIYSGIWLGFLLGDLMPWREADKLLPFNASTYFYSFFTLALPNLFFCGALFFMSGALSRKSIVIYTQGILLLVLYSVGQNMIKDMDHKHIAALLDPFGMRAFSYITEYWTPAERNTLLAPLEGYLLYNRLIWLGVGVLALVVTYFGFSFNVVRNGIIKKSKVLVIKNSIKPESVKIPFVKQYFGFGAQIQQLLKLTTFYFRMVFKEIPFLGIVTCGLLLLFADSINMNEMYGTSSYPTTYSILGLLGEFNLFFLIIAVLYSGELVWRERTVNINLIVDTMPLPDFIGLVSKFLGMLLVYIVLLLLLIACGVIIQMAYGYYNFELPIYFSTLYTETLMFLVLYTLLSLFIQVMVNNKFLGYALTIVFFIVMLVASRLGLEHGLFQFGSGSLGTYSDMNIYGHFVTPFSWFQVYWFGFTALLFGVAVVFSVRGSEAVMKMRWKYGKLRLNRSLLTFLFAFAIVFICSGFYIFYNTNIANSYRNSDAQLELQAEYENTLKKFEFIPQPRIVEASLKVDIYPKKRDFVAEGFYYLKNKTDQPINQIHIQQNTDEDLKIDDVRFDREAKVSDEYGKFKYYIYDLTQPLAAGDSVKMSFKLSYITTGFKDKGSNTSIIYNGTFFNNSYFPGLGYNDGYEISSDDDRKDQKLPEKERMLERNDPRGLAQSLFGDDADHIRFDLQVSTDNDQIALAPGYLQKEWMEGDRKYFHYKMDAPMCNFYSVLSAKYEVKKDKYKDVNLEIYYHKGHEYNLDKMMEGMKDALGYFEKNFSPYQYRQVRILEFPRYATFAQSFANTIPFSEGIGFIQKVDDPDKDLDMTYYVTAHEVAHQWWGHQVMEAGVKGNAMLSESMSQYSALMVMKQKFSPEIIEKYLKYELDRYLAGRTREVKKEQPLEFVESQGYIHYNKASLIFYALQDYISEDSVNSAFRRFNQQWAFKDAPYPTSADLLKEIRQVTPDSMQYIVTDMFETITLFENKAESADYVKKSDTEYEVILKLSSEKMRADSTGMETTIAVNDWIDIGVYTKDDKGKDKLIYLKKHKINQKENTFTIIVDQKPSKAGIDPMHKLIDRHSNDNTKAVLLKEGV